MIGGGWTRAFVDPAAVPPLSENEQAEIVLTHFWIEERSRLSSINADTGEVVLERPSKAPLHASYGTALSDFFFENIRSCVTEPGDWYLDHDEDLVYYIPFPDESMDAIKASAPTALQLLVMRGDATSGKYIDGIGFDGLTFQHTDWRHPDKSDGARFWSPPPPAGPADEFHVGMFGRRTAAGSGQAAADVPGVVSLEGARDVSFSNCSFRALGWYGIQIGDGSTRVTVEQCDISDTGAGAVSINGSNSRGPIERRTSHISIVDSHFHEGGRVFFSCVGVLSAHAHDIAILRNHIHDFYYSGVSVGWVWGYGESVSRNNRIEFNHIHTLGQGVLSDIGGIYTLGVQPGTVIRGNHVHDITKVHYGAWCIYLDAGSSHILVEGNLCHTTEDTIFHQNFGRENLIRNNVFGHAKEAVVSLGIVHREHTGFRMHRNLLVTKGESVFRCNDEAGITDPNVESDLNVVVTAGGVPPAFRHRFSDTVADWTGWQRGGQDRHSLHVDSIDPPDTACGGMDEIGAIVEQLRVRGQLETVGYTGPLGDPSDAADLGVSRG
jgi:hypothetical protein